MGKAGTGKTYMAKAIAESIMGQPVYVINCSQWTSPIEIRGGQTIKGYEEGLLIKAWANGGILILDELPKLDPNTAGLLNDALAEAAKQPIYNEDGSVDESTIPTITNGRGQKIKKGQLFE
jgi:cobaltochelatase CobS